MQVVEQQDESVARHLLQVRDDRLEQPEPVVRRRRRRGDLGRGERTGVVAQRLAPRPERGGTLGRAPPPHREPARGGELAERLQQPGPPDPRRSLHEHDADLPGARDVQAVGQHPQLGLPADDPARPDFEARPPVHRARGRPQRRVLAQQAHLQLGRLDGRVHPQLAREVAAQRGELREGVRLPSGAVEGGGQHPAHRLVQRGLRREPGQLRDDPGARPEVEVRPQAGRRQLRPPGVQALALTTGEGE